MRKAESSQDLLVRLEKLVRFVKTSLAVILVLMSMAWSLNLFSAVGLVLFPEQFLAAMIGLGLAMVFLHFPIKRGRVQNIPPWFDMLASIAGLTAGFYVAATFPDLSARVFEAPLDAKITGFLLVVLCVEGLRRSAGFALVIIVAVFIAYSFVGHLVPGALETRKVGLNQLVIYLGLNSSALLGLVTLIATTVVIVFIFFGQLLSRSGGTQFFSDISLATMGGFRGGSAKIAIFASSLFGSVSGVAIANIVATGVVTIPLMKKGGYSARMAAAIEAVASTGGQLMPPVMGAVAFLMADFLELPYREIVIAALGPSILYYVSLFIQADLEAARDGIKAVEKNLVSSPGTVMRKGWQFTLPFIALIGALFFWNWRPETAALLACVVVIFVGLIFGYEGRRMTLQDVWNAIIATAYDSLEILMIVAGSGFIIGVLQITGLGFALTALLVDMGGHNLFVLLLISGALCIVLGMGMPTLGVYVLLAVLIAPALIESGVRPLAAHMFILYLGMMSLITPPVAVAAFFAAGIAKSTPMMTGWTCMRFGWTAYVVPFLFVVSPNLLFEGSALNILLALGTAIAGVWFTSAGLVGYLLQPISFIERCANVGVGILLLIPHDLASWGIWTDAFGILFAAIILISNVYQSSHSDRPRRSI